MRIMAILGAFVFSANSKEFHKMDKETTYHYAKINKVSAPTEYHAVGGHEEKRTLSGRINVLESGSEPLAVLETMGELKLEYPLFLGNGRYLGLYIIEKVSIKESKIIDNGAAIQVDFTLKVTRTDGGLLAWLKAQDFSLGGLI